MSPRAPSRHTELPRGTGSIPAPGRAGGAGFAPSPAETALPRPCGRWGVPARCSPSSLPQHQQQVVQAVERAKQVTMTDLNAAIGVRQPSACHCPHTPAFARGAVVRCCGYGERPPSIHPSSSSCRVGGGGGRDAVEGCGGPRSSAGDTLGSCPAPAHPAPSPAGPGLLVGRSSRFPLPCSRPDAALRLCSLLLLLSSTSCRPSTSRTTLPPSP